MLDNEHYDDDELEEDELDTLEDGDPEPELPEGAECEICDSPATTVHDCLYYCDDCFETDIMHH